MLPPPPPCPLTRRRWKGGGMPCMVQPDNPPPSPLLCLFLSSIYYGSRRADRSGSLISIVPIYVHFCPNIQVSRKYVMHVGLLSDESTPCVQTIKSEWPFYFLRLRRWYGGSPPFSRQEKERRTKNASEGQASKHT